MIVESGLRILDNKYSSRDLLLMCSSEYEIKEMRKYVSKHPNSDTTANSFFLLYLPIV